VEQGLKSSGGSLVSRARVAPGTPDYAPALATVLGSGAKCIFLALPPNESAKVLSAVAQRPTRPLLGSGVTSIPQQVISRVPADVVEGTVLVGTSYAYTDDVEPIRRMTAEAKATGVPENQLHGAYAVQAWSAATIALDTLKGIKGTVNAKSVLKAMGNIRQPESGPFGAFTTTTEFGAPGLKRLFNRNTLTYVVKTGRSSSNLPSGTT
jgi:ABC-type branched-subunit amino acid transport system substrate-binding protein